MTDGLQGDKEKALGVKVSPFMDRGSTVIKDCQTGFLGVRRPPHMFRLSGTLIRLIGP